jgi:BMFP domain-containing protein YqiC
LVSDDFNIVRILPSITSKRNVRSHSEIVRLGVRCGLLVLLLQLFGAAGSAKSVTEYHLRVRQAITALDTIEPHDESESETVRTARIGDTLAGIRTALPKTENVEMGDVEVAVDNSWLHRDLDTYEKTPATRAEVLARTLERLRALEQRLAEFDKTATKTADKSESNKKLNEILSRPEYAGNANNQSALTRLLNDFMKWLERFLPKPKQFSPGRAMWVSRIAQVLVVLLALGVIAYVLRQFAPRLLAGRGRKKKAKERPRIVLGETLEPDESAGDILAEAEALARRGELRAAIRKAYIALLVELGDRKILSLAQHKTNRDYLRAVREVEPLHSNVKQLTDSFERHWYGFALATDADWASFRDRYKRALQELN